MKKKITLLLLAVIMLLPFIKVKALANDSYVDWNLDRSIFAHQYRNGSDHITNLAMMTVNGVYGYCIEPGILAHKASYYSSTTNINDTPLSGIDTKRLSLIGYYGYGYEGHNTKEYYMGDFLCTYVLNRIKSTFNSIFNAKQAVARFDAATFTN